MEKVRDRNLDLFRGFAMFYVTCISHLFYWLNLPVDHKDLLLIEMPLIFFIAGAAHTMSKKHNLKDFIVGRIHRVVFPYWGFLIVLLIFTSSIQAFLGGGIDIIAYIKAIFLLGAGKNLSFANTSHLWFVMPYFIISIMIMAIYKIFHTNYTNNLLNLSIIFICILYLCITTFHFRDNHNVNRGGVISVYTAFYVIGFYYKKIFRDILILPNLWLWSIILFI